MHAVQAATAALAMVAEWRSSNSKPLLFRGVLLLKRRASDISKHLDP
jgi:hypothetical protein